MGIKIQGLLSELQPLDG